MGPLTYDKLRVDVWVLAHEPLHDRDGGVALLGDGEDDLEFSGVLLQERRLEVFVEVAVQAAEGPQDGYARNLVGGDGGEEGFRMGSAVTRPAGGVQTVRRVLFCSAQEGSSRHEEADRAEGPVHCVPHEANRAATRVSTKHKHAQQPEYSRQESPNHRAKSWSNPSQPRDRAKTFRLGFEIKSDSRRFRPLMNVDLLPTLSPPPRPRHF